MAKTPRFAYNKHADILDISIGKPKQALSREVEDAFFVHVDPRTGKVTGFSILNFTKWSKDRCDVHTVPLKAEFSLVRAAS